MSDTPSRQVIHDGRVVKLGLETVTLPDGRRTVLEIVRHQGAAAVVPIDDLGQVVLINQYRHAAGGMILEVPAGVVEPGEAPEVCAARELTEETGLRARRLERLGTILTTPGFTDERIHLFVAHGLEAAEGRLDHDEYIEVQRVPVERALEFVAEGRIVDAKTICALHLALCREG